MRKYVLIAAAAMVVFAASLLMAGDLVGAGATFPYPLYTKMFSEYKKVKGSGVNYQGIGSGGGIEQLTSKTVDFGASDAPMNSKEMKQAGADVVHIPTCLGAVVLTYNLPGNPKLKLTPDVIAGIYLGKIAKWNDPAIAAANAGVTLPDLNIIVVRRSDSSGTTYTFTDYLSAVSPEWKTKVGVNKSPNWPGTTLGGKGNPGVGGYVKQNVGAIGYVELAYAVQLKLPYASVQNKSGNFVDASPETISLSADVTLPPDGKVSLVNTSAANGYPIATFTWLLVYREQNYGGKPRDKAVDVVNLLWWIVHDGQVYNEPLLYGRLPEKAVQLDETLIKSITYGGKPIRK